MRVLKNYLFEYINFFLKVVACADYYFINEGSNSNGFVSYKPVFEKPQLPHKHVIYLTVAGYK